ncbi:MAG: hypothetical protein HKN22_00575 [Bacteroidia bacterium]|nr:hypothetical protein [Bacteroidia bacterium]
MKKKKIIVIVAMSALCIGVFGASMVFKGPRKLNNVKADLVINSSDLYEEYSINEEEANNKFLNKIIEVEGTVQDISFDDSGNMNIYLQTSETAMGTVSCNILKENIADAKDIKVGDKVGIKGLCSGYLIDVVLTKCVINNKS